MNSNLDQELANMRDSVPRMWWAIYEGCIEAGFNDKQAIVLLQTFIVAQAGGKLVFEPPFGVPKVDL